jgi:hypothetical protein
LLELECKVVALDFLSVYCCVTSLCQVTTLLNHYDPQAAAAATSQLQQLQQQVQQQGSRVKEVKEAAKAEAALKPEVEAAVQELLRLKQKLGVSGVAWRVTMV